MKHLAPALMVLIGLGLAPLDRSGARAADEGEELGLQLKQTWEALKDYTIEQKNVLAEESEDLLAALDVQIDQARAAAAGASGEAREQWNETVANLGIYREEASRRFENLQESSAGAWDDAKQSLSETLEDLQQALDDEPPADG
jgi:uncharacterized protein with von Willebrand factor type A (vWA) domain